MARKGDETLLGPQAERLYGEGHTLSEISHRLGVSVTSLKRWKDKTKVPGQTLDGWDKCRSQKQSNIARLRDLFEDQLNHLESVNAGDRTAPMMDTLSKLGALLERYDKMEKAQKVADEVVEEASKTGGLSDEAAALIRNKILGINS